MHRLAIATMPTTAERQVQSLRAAFTADAASLGLHWLYDYPRLEALAADGHPLAFRAPDRAAYEGVSGYYAHENRTAGQLSHYGEGMVVLAESLIATPGAFDTTVYLAHFEKFFGLGYDGYRDHATRETLVNLAAGTFPTGTSDDQVSATAKLPPLIIALLTHPEMPHLAEQAASATNDHPLAREGARIVTAALGTALLGATLADSLAAGLAESTSLRPALTAALALDDVSPAVASQEFGPACGLASALPLSFHLLLRAPSWEALIEGNILAGGDSCGRATFIGALYAAAHGLPEGMFAKLKDATALDLLIHQLVSLSSPQVEREN